MHAESSWGEGSREEGLAPGHLGTSKGRIIAFARDGVACFLIYLAFYPLDRWLVLPGITGLLERQSYGTAFLGMFALLIARMTVLLLPSFLAGWKAQRHAALWGLACLPCFLATYTVLSLMVSAATGHLDVQAGLAFRPSAGNAVVSLCACAALYAVMGSMGAVSRKRFLRRESRKRNRRNAVG